MQRIEQAQARQSALNNQLTIHVDEATHRVRESCTEHGPCNACAKC